MSSDVRGGCLTCFAIIAVALRSKITFYFCFLAWSGFDAQCTVHVQSGQWTVDSGHCTLSSAQCNIQRITAHLVGLALDALVLGAGKVDCLLPEKEGAEWRDGPRHRVLHDPGEEVPLGRGGIVHDGGSLLASVHRVTAFGHPVVVHPEGDHFAKHRPVGHSLRSFNILFFI